MRKSIRMICAVLAMSCPADARTTYIRIPWALSLWDHWSDTYVDLTSMQVSNITTSAWLDIYVPLPFMQGSDSVGEGLGMDSGTGMNGEYYVIVSDQSSTNAVSANFLMYITGASSYSVCSYYSDGVASFVGSSRFRIFPCNGAASIVTVGIFIPPKASGTSGFRGLDVYNVF